MENQIKAILTGLPDVKVKPVGNLWSVCAGGISGSSEDGLELAHRIKSQYEYIKPRPVSAPQPMEEPVQVGHMDEPDDLEIPRFLAPAPEPAPSVPDDLQALAEPGETTEQTRARLWALYREIQNKIMMALASREEVRLHERLHNHMGWLAAADERDF